MGHSLEIHSSLEEVHGPEQQGVHQSTSGNLFLENLSPTLRHAYRTTNNNDITTNGEYVQYHLRMVCKSYVYQGNKL